MAWASSARHQAVGAGRPSHLSSYSGAACGRPLNRQALAVKGERMDARAHNDQAHGWGCHPTPRHAVVGLGFGGLAVHWFLGGESSSFSKLADPRQICEPAGRGGLSGEECWKLVSQLDASELHGLMSSGRFRLCFYFFIGLGTVFNVSLVAASLRLVRSRDAGGVTLLVVLMLTFAGYTQLLPFPEEDSWGVPFAAAWGVGNMGLGPMLLTRVWIWAPIMALLASIPWRSS